MNERAPAKSWIDEFSFCIPVVVANSCEMNFVKKVKVEMRKSDSH